mmetsp:Transcript_46310/g.99161  ORF Transcript_46310/g.99161 Transcript_46310/m.99161 type:complete len:105 (-) Transcript_46310:2368-2682(-)
MCILSLLVLKREKITSDRIVFLPPEWVEYSATTLATTVHSLLDVTTTDEPLRHIFGDEGVALTCSGYDERSNVVLTQPDQCIQQSPLCYTSIPHSEVGAACFRS